MGTTSLDSALGAVRNPWDLEHIAGGSSGGSAAAIVLSILAEPGSQSVQKPDYFAGLNRRFTPRIGIVTNFESDKEVAGRGFAVGEDFTVVDIVAAYTLDWANEVGLLDDCPQLLEYLKRMYARQNAAPRIAAALASIKL